MVVIDNIGPIEHLELDAKPGTITVLRGMNGEGKTTALDAVSALTRGAGKLESRDNTTGGRVSGFGVQIKVGRGGANRRTGDLVVTAVEDRLSIADFVEPNVKDPYAADARRLKALVSLAGVEADPTIFHDLVGGKPHFDEIVGPQTLEIIDPILMAEAIKRDIEKMSRIHTTRAERLWGEVKAKLAANEGLDLGAEHDADLLERRRDMAVQYVGALTQRATSARAAADQRAGAQRALENAERTYRGPTLEAAEKQVKNADAAWEIARQSWELQGREVEDLRQRLHETEMQLSAKRAKVAEANGIQNDCRATVAAVKKHAETLAAWQQTLDTVEELTAPTVDECDRAARDLETAREDDHRGVLIRAAIARQAEADALDKDRAVSVTRAEFLREAAKSVLDVLAETVKGLIPGLKLDPELRIIVPHKKRGQCFYADLSHGERWTMALDIAVAAFERRDERGVLAIPQEAWEGLDGRNRKVIADHVATTDLIVFTAEAERSFESPAGGIEVDVIQGGKAKP